MGTRHRESRSIRRASGVGTGPSRAVWLASSVWLALLMWLRCSAPVSLALPHALPHALFSIRRLRPVSLSLSSLQQALNKPCCLLARHWASTPHFLRRHIDVVVCRVLLCAVLPATSLDFWRHVEQVFLGRNRSTVVDANATPVTRCRALNQRSASGLYGTGTRARMSSVNQRGKKGLPI
ncbi:hypothetical protein GGR56DRAFT_522060 [Xylariaceae sp. FL0804]|nr:hypothetical protein GGR56DRAFT_522060 [Xylariaceae sp. FL0804]